MKSRSHRILPRDLFMVPHFGPLDRAMVVYHRPTLAHYRATIRAFPLCWVTA